MSKRVALALAVPLAAATVGFAGVSSASALVPTCDCAPVVDEATPLSPDAASALVAAPGNGDMSAAVVVDPATALAAASAPGADTSIESDLTPEQAVGLTPESAAAAAANPPMCWTDHGWWEWGIWPYEQRVDNITYWCAVYGSRITLRTSTVTGGGTLCGVAWRASALLAGGVGFTSFTERSTVGFNCPTSIPWITLHPTRYMDIRFDDRGSAAIVGVG